MLIMENYFILSGLIIIGILVFLWNPNTDKDGRTSEEIQASLIRKEQELKAIYANMAEYDRIIIERNNAIKNGDMELYKQKVKEASICFEKGNEYFKNK